MRSRSVHFLCTCEQRSAAQWRLPKKKCIARRKNRNLAMRSASLFASNQKVHRTGSQSPLHFDIKNPKQIRSEKYFPSAQRLLSAALLERWPQVCRFKITFKKLPTNSFVCTTKKSMKCVVSWIPLRIRVRSRNTQPHLKERVQTRPFEK